MHPMSAQHCVCAALSALHCECIAEASWPIRCLQNPTHPLMSRPSANNSPSRRSGVKIDCEYWHDFQCVLNAIFCTVGCSLFTIFGSNKRTRLTALLVLTLGSAIKYYRSRANTVTPVNRKRRISLLMQ